MVGLARLEEVIEDCGFDVVRGEGVPATMGEDAQLHPPKVPECELRELVVPVDGMTCNKCTGWIAAALQKVDGVQQVVEVSLIRKVAVVSTTTV
jgi:hypothetical protein